MQDETPKTTATTATNPALGRSSVAKLPADLREAVDREAAEAAKPKPRKGLSPEMVARIDEAVLGKARWPVRTVTSVPIDPWNPDESPLSRSIPHNPAESRPSTGPSSRNDKERGCPDTRNESGHVRA